MTVRLLAIAALLAAASTARAQIPYDPDRNQGIGFTAGVASGTGVSYQEILPSALGYRGTLFGWKTGGSSFFDIGASGIRVLNDNGRRRVYLIGGTSYWRWSDEETVTEFDADGNVIGERELNDVKRSWSLGLGVGVDLPLSRDAAISLEGLFTYWGRTGNFLPLPQISVHYLF